jgi:2Fe-2S ferredoxin
MPTIHFVHPNGQTTSLDAPVGKSIMNVCRDHGFTEVVAECGGLHFRATCHVYVDNTQYNLFSKPK